MQFWTEIPQKMTQILTCRHQRQKWLASGNNFAVSANLIYPLRGNFFYPFAIGWIKQYSNFEDLVSSETMTKVFFFCRKRNLDHKPFARLDLSLPKPLFFSIFSPFSSLFVKKNPCQSPYFSSYFLDWKKENRRVWTRNILAKSSIILAKNAEEMQKGKG